MVGHRRGEGEASEKQENQWICEPGERGFHVHHAGDHRQQRHEQGRCRERQRLGQPQKGDANENAQSDPDLTGVQRGIVGKRRPEPDRRDDQSRKPDHHQPSPASAKERLEHIGARHILVGIPWFGPRGIVFPRLFRSPTAATIHRDGFLPDALVFHKSAAAGWLVLLHPAGPEVGSTQ